MSHRPLTDRQKSILQWIIKSTVKNYMQPSMDEIADEFHVTKGYIFQVLTVLEKKGYIELHGLKRGITFTKKAV